MNSALAAVVTGVFFIGVIVCLKEIDKTLFEIKEVLKKKENEKR